MRTVYHKSMKIFIGSQSGEVYVKVNENEFMGYDDFLSGGTALREDQWGENLIALQNHEAICQAIDVVRRYEGKNFMDIIWACSTMAHEVMGLTEDETIRGEIALTIARNSKR